MKDSIKSFASAILLGLCMALPSQKVMPKADPEDLEFPLPQPLPENGTLPSVDYELYERLHTAPSAGARIALLPDSAFKFDYLDPPEGNVLAKFEGKGGSFINAIGATMPGLVGDGISMSVGFTKPCGFNTPYTHPRASEVAIVVKGRMITEFVTETGARKIRHEHAPYTMAVFPQGSLHLEFNPDCDDVVFVTAFNSEDPGINTPGESLFMLDDDFAALGLGLEFLPGADIDVYCHLVPATLAQGVESCLRRCGIRKNGGSGDEL